VCCILLFPFKSCCLATMASFSFLLFALVTDLNSFHRCVGVSYMRHIRTNKAQVAIVSHLKEVARLSSRLICRLYATLLSPIQVNYSFFGSSYAFPVGTSRKPPLNDEVYSV
jgi:hypothetical protein